MFYTLYATAPTLYIYEWNEMMFIAANYHIRKNKHYSELFLRI